MPRLVESLDAIDFTRTLRSVHLVVGTFDGVHEGHRRLIERVVGTADARNACAVAFTFQNHPRAVLAPDKAPPLLTPWPEKRALLEALPLDAIVAIPFTKQFSRIKAEEFVSDVLIGRCDARAIFSGPNFHFGRGALGNPDLLRRVSASQGIEYECVQLALEDGSRISSTWIRELLLEGEVAHAAKLLGRPHMISGAVVAGDGRGRQIGFPTANIAPRAECLVPRDGVYAVRARLGGGGETLDGMMNIGWRPTFDGRDRRLEVNLLGFEEDIVGRPLEIDFVGRLRDEKRFDGVDSLVAQLHRDRAAAVAVLA